VVRTLPLLTASLTYGVLYASLVATPSLATLLRDQNAARWA